MSSKFISHTVKNPKSKKTTYGFTLKELQEGKNVCYQTAETMYIFLSFVSCMSCLLSGDQIKKTEMGRAYSTYGEEMYIQVSGGET
jgi:hypothetical protein